MLFQQFQSLDLVGTVVGDVLGLAVGVGINAEISEIGVAIRVHTTVITLIIRMLFSSKRQEVQLGQLPTLFSQMLKEEYQRHLIDLRKYWFERSNSVSMVELNTVWYFLLVTWSEMVGVLSSYFG